MILRQLQELIGGIYDVRITHDVYDFLVTDRRQLPPSVRASVSDEELIVEQAPDGSDLAMSLYLDPALLERLSKADPMQRLHHGNVADCWTALEGVSHFLYLAWHAGHDRAVSLLELEMQAEVDKYVATHFLMRRQLPERFPSEVLHLLFEKTRIDPRLADGREALYREASRHAQRFCQRLQHALRHAQGRDQSAILAELRRFYRLTDTRKVAHIERDR